MSTLKHGEIVFCREINTLCVCGRHLSGVKLIAKVRSGGVRILIGSTPMMGAGTNIQDRLIALHNLDCPWRPSDLEQRQGRIERKGNQFEEI